jgi:hypothetical protein
MNTHSRRRTPKSARLAILLGLAAFVTLQLGLATAIELWLPSLGDPECACKLDRLRRRAGLGPERPLTIVMLGSSRTLYGFRGGQLENYLTRPLGGRVRVANFGMLGAGPVLELLALNRLFADRRRPDLLLIEVLPATLAGQLAVTFEERALGISRVRLSELTLLAHLRFLGDQLYPECLQTWPVPCLTHRFDILSRVVPGWLAYEVRTDRFETCDPSGWSPLIARPMKPAEHDRIVRWSQEVFSPYLQGFSPGGVSCRALRELLERCRHNAIPAALVLMPEAGECRRWYPPAAWAQVRSLLAALGHEYAVPVINARQWVAESDFADPHHLLPRGADVFTHRLGPLVLALLRGREPGSIFPGEASSGIRVLSAPR